MTIEVVCPHCSFSKKTPIADIPPGAKRAVCPKCRQRFDISLPRSGEGGEEGEAFGERESRQDAPWERRSELGLWRSIYETFKGVLFSPGDVFGPPDFEKGIGAPLAFGLLLGSIGGMFSLFWQFLLASEGMASLWPAELGQHGAGLLFAALAVMVPFFVAIAIFVYSGVLHLLLMMVRGGANGFEATFRVVSYSHAAQAWSIVPFIGGWIGGIWQLVVQVIGLQKIHQTTYGKVIAAFLIPVILVAALTAALVVPLLLRFF